MSKRKNSARKNSKPRPIAEVVRDVGIALGPELTDEYDHAFDGMMGMVVQHIYEELCMYMSAVVDRHADVMRGVDKGEQHGEEDRRDDDND